MIAHVTDPRHELALSCGEFNFVFAIPHSAQITHFYLLAIARDWPLSLSLLPLSFLYASVIMIAKIDTCPLRR